jgi:hypothetical protein
VSIDFASSIAAVRRLRMPSRLRPIPLVAAVLGLASLVIFLFFALGGDYQPDSAAGMGFGIAAAAALFIVMLYSIRRSLPAVRVLGRTKTYLDVHIHGGLLFMLLVLVHTGFGVPAGPLLIVLWVLSLWVVVSGLVGLALQRSVPRMLDAASTFEVNLKRIPELVVELRSRAEKLAMRAGPGAQSYYARELAPDMEMPRSTLSSLLGFSRIQNYRSQEFEILKRTLPPESGPMLDEMFQLHGTKLQMDLHYTMQRLLRFWLYFHLPTAIVLIGLVVLHVFFVVYF